MYTLDVDVFGSILAPRAGLNHSPFTLSPHTKTKSVTPDFGAADAGSRILSTSQNLVDGILLVTTNLSRAAKLVVWARDHDTKRLVIEPFITDEELQTHVLRIPVARGSKTRIFDLFQEISNV
jgi:hypothetical protein